MRGCTRRVHAPLRATSIQVWLAIKHHGRGGARFCRSDATIPPRISVMGAAPIPTYEQLEEKPMKNNDELLTELLDREAIRELPVRYCDCVWRNDMAGIVQLFAEDGSFTVKGHKRLVTQKGRAELKKMYEGALSNVNPPPHTHHPVVDLTAPNSGVGRCYVEPRSF